jgi:predicted transcriptional regulator
VKNRSRADIVGDILSITGEGALKTHIMYGAALSFAQLKEYLEMMLDRDLVKYSMAEREYKTTDRGLHYLQMYREAKHMLRIPRGIT